MADRGASDNIPAITLKSAQDKARKLLKFSKEAKHMNLSEFVGWLKGKKIEVQTNEVDGQPVFEVAETPEPVTPPTPAPLFSEVEVAALKGLAASAEAITNALKDVPAAVQMAHNVEAQAQAQKDQLVATVLVNATNPYSECELKAMPESALVKLNAQLNTNYAAAGGGRTITNDEKPLTVKPVLLAKKEA
jgi:hypothetical protein